LLGSVLVALGVLLVAITRRRRRLPV